MMNWMTATELESSESLAGEPTSPTDEQPVSMPLSSMTRGQGMSHDPLSDAEASDNPDDRGLLNNNAVLLTGIVVIAIGSLLAMRWSQGSLDISTPSAASAKIDTALAKLNHPDQLADNSPLRSEVRQAMFQDTDAIVAMFTIDPTQSQVPLKYTRKNPFRITPDKPERVNKPDTHDADAAARERKVRLEKLRQTAKGMELQSVMGGKTPMAVINGEFYRVGAKVEGFTIASINRFTVDLVAGKQHFKLTMNQ